MINKGDVVKITSLLDCDSLKPFAKYILNKPLIYSPVDKLFRFVETTDKEAYLEARRKEIAVYTSVNLLELANDILKDYSPGFYFVSGFEYEHLF